MDKKIKDIFVIGFALFAMFFGAGNLIFPVYLGKVSGSNYPMAMMGFVITATGLPLLGIIAGIKAGGSADKVASKVNRKFAVLIITALILCIGPLFAIPRTAATTFEIAVKPFSAAFNPIIFYFIYFIINIAFVMKPSKIIDIIGSILTPVLLTALFILIIKGMIYPVGAIAHMESANTFSKSLIEGYQTMDAMAAVIFSSIILSSAVSKGYKEEKDIIRVTVLAGIVAVAGLGIIYGGLVYIGTQASTAIPGDIEKVQLIVQLSNMILGKSGMVIISIAVSLACLTTSIGLIATSSQYFEKLSKGRLNYRVNVFVISIVSIMIASLGVDKIINLAVPALNIIYPIIIVLIFSKIAEKLVRNDFVVAGTVYTTFIIAVLDTFNIFGFKKFASYLPLSSAGFTWVTPALIVFIILNLRYTMGIKPVVDKE